MLLLLILVITFIGCGKKVVPVKISTKLAVHAVNVETAPKLDGKGNDSVWRRAPVAFIPAKDGMGATIKSVYTDTMIYFLVSWKDATPQTGRLYWVYDGQKWTSNLEQDDKISFIWNMNHSVQGFDKTGCQALCHNYDGHDTMQIKGRSAPGKVWPGYKQMADAWKWAPGVMNEKHVVDDGLFSAGREALARPDIQQSFDLKLLFDGGDQGTKQWWTRNPNAGEGEGGGEEAAANEAPGSYRPAYMPRPGFNLDKNPFPNMRDMVPITDYSIFKAGDKLPMILYFDLTSEKNLKDFPEGQPSGSRVDISGFATYSSTGMAYTLEFGRKLDTKHPDDTQFRPKSGETVADNVFGLAIFNDTRFNHSVSGPVTLVLEPRP